MKNTILILNMVYMSLFQLIKSSQQPLKNHSHHNRHILNSQKLKASTKNRLKTSLLMQQSFEKKDKIEHLDTTQPCIKQQNEKTRTRFQKILARASNHKKHHAK